MMPEIDGFGILEELKYDKRTQGIPVIVVSAKDMTREDRQRLNGHIKAVYQEGKLPRREFVDQGSKSGNGSRIKHKENPDVL